MSSIVDRDEGDNSMGNEDIRGGRNPDASKLLSLCCACVKESVIGLGVPSAAGMRGCTGLYSFVAVCTGLYSFETVCMGLYSFVTGCMGLYSFETVKSLKG